SPALAILASKAPLPPTLAKSAAASSSGMTTFTGLPPLAHRAYERNSARDVRRGGGRVRELIADAFRMTDEVWQRHANPWSVYTRFAAIPPLLAAIWSRAWIGVWCLVPIALVAVWLWLNPRVFAPVSLPVAWASKGIY